MRHTAYIKLKKYRLTYSLMPNHSPPIKPDELFDYPSKALNEDDCVLYALRVHQLQAKVRQFLACGKRDNHHRNDVIENTEPITGQDYDKYMHNIVRGIFETAIIANAATEAKTRDEVFRRFVDDMYKEFFFHHNYTKSLELPQTLRCVYSTFSMIEHSCEPNCFAT